MTCFSPLRLWALKLLVLGGFLGCARPEAPVLSYNASVAEAIRETLESGVDVGGGGAASLAEPTGWATVRGQFQMQGTPPTRNPLTVNKDIEVCAPGGSQVLEESVVVDSGGGVKNILVFVSTKVPDDPAWVHESFADSKSADVEFDQKNCIFLSHVSGMRSTQRLKVLNSDPVGHNTNLDSKRGAASGNFTVPANSYAFYEPRASSPAPFPVTCSIHPWMKAHMMVFDHPYFAVTADDGSFEISNVPAGVELEFRVWQEAAGYVEQVSVNGQADKWSKGRFTVNLAPNDEYQMDVVVDNSLFQ